MLGQRSFQELFGFFNVSAGASHKSSESIIQQKSHGILVKSHGIFFFFWLRKCKNPDLTLMHNLCGLWFV